MKNVLMLFFRSKKTHKENPCFCTPKPTLIILTFFPSEWARGKMTIGNQWRKLHAIVNNICIWFFVSILHDLLYWEMLNPAEWGRESEMSSMAAAVMQVPSSVTLDSYFSPQKYLILSNLTTAATSIPVPLVMGTLFK